MKVKKVVLSIVLAFYLMLNNIASATKLPQDVWKYIKQSLPNAQQRFDSVITLSDDVMYIPLYPPSDTTVESIQIDYTYPDKKPLSALPEVVLFNNGYSLLKVFKDEKGNYTLTKKDDLPIKVRLGLMPQDMLTPVGLKMPESLKLTLGDLLIPSKEENSLALNNEEKEKIKSPYAPQVKRNEFIPVVDFKDKKTFINPQNSKFLSVYDSTSKEPLYELKLSSMPSKIVTSEKSKVALVLYWSTKNLEIIDLKDERTIATIPIDAQATDVALNKKENLAYVTSQNAKAIYVVNLNSMQLDKVVKLDQKPSKITYCDLDESISFYDEYTQQIYNVTKSGAEFIVQPLGKVANVSKILSDIANVYVLSRTDSQLYVFDKAQAKQISVVDLDKKPTDALIYEHKIFILCSKEGYMDVYDTVEGKIVSREQLSKDGFYSKLTLIPNDNNIMITGINAKSYLIYNPTTMKLVKTQESYIDVANIIILDKSQRL